MAKIRSKDGAPIAYMVAYLLDWGERPDAFFATLHCAALGWVA